MALWLWVTDYPLIPAFAILPHAPAVAVHAFALGYRRAAYIIAGGFALGAYFFLLGFMIEGELEHILRVALGFHEAKSPFNMLPSEVYERSWPLAGIHYVHAGAAVAFSLALAFWVEKRFPNRSRQVPDLNYAAYAMYAFAVVCWLVAWSR